jgi:hypothetical protein
MVVIPLPASLAAARVSADPMARRGVPPHVTILFPFLAGGDLTPTVHATLVRLATARDPFVARFARFERGHQVVWLVPDEQSAFLQLTTDLASEWPDHPPYGGIHGDDLVAHLTLVETADADQLDVVWAAASAGEPFQALVSELTVIVEDAAGRWHERWRLPLGQRPGALDLAND